MLRGWGRGQGLHKERGLSGLNSLPTLLQQQRKEHPGFLTLTHNWGRGRKDAKKLSENIKKKKRESSLFTADLKKKRKKEIKISKFVKLVEYIKLCGSCSHLHALIRYLPV